MHIRPDAVAQLQQPLPLFILQEDPTLGHASPRHLQLGLEEQNMPPAAGLPWSGKR